LGYKGCTVLRVMLGRVADVELGLRLGGCLDHRGLFVAEKSGGNGSEKAMKSVK
jgi:hypothetical protein